MHRLPWWAAVLAAALGGWLFDLANPGVAAWPLVFVAIGLMLASWWQQRPGVAVLAGLAAGATFWLTHLNWLTLYLGPVPWLGLAVVMAAWFTLQGWATAVATRGIRSFTIFDHARAFRPRTTVACLIATQAIAATGIWVLREGVQGSWPYGGFSWGRVAHVFAETPLRDVVSWTGFAGLSALVVLAIAAIIGVTLSVSSGAGATRGRTQIARPLITAGTVAAVFALLALVPAYQLETTGTLRVAAVQGNSKSGIFDDRESGDVYADHVTGTEELLDELEANGETVDVIVWPENSAEFGLTHNPLRAHEVARLSERAGAPIIAGSVLQNDDGSYTNSSVVWGPDGQQEAEVGSRYDKRFPVPFAEYMPNRDFFHMFAPDLVDLVQLEYTPGEFAPVVNFEAEHGAGSAREIVAGIAICFDIIFDNQAVEMVGNGAQVIFAPTNNADFGRTDESVQQLQIARLRAAETGRALVNISTVGTSAIVGPDGRDLDRIDAFTRGALVSEVPLVTGKTPALALGAAISATWMVLGAAGIALGAVGIARGRIRR